MVSVMKYLSRMNLEILILRFENRNCFDVSLKQFAFEILQLLGYLFLFFGKKDDFFLCWQYFLVKVHHKVTFSFCGF
jgi:hypothetical protein